MNHGHTMLMYLSLFLHRIWSLDFTTIFGQLALTRLILLNVLNVEEIHILKSQLNFTYVASLRNFTKTMKKIATVLRF